MRIGVKVLATEKASLPAIMHNGGRSNLEAR
jgi:hypothetical protein